MDSDETKPIGRPTKYKPEYAEFAARLGGISSVGVTDEEFATVFDVAPSTIALWKLEHPEFSEATKKAKDQADANVERSLYERAKGYSHPDVDIRTVALGNNSGSEIVQTPIIKHYAPSEVACIFWLKNRRPKQWRDKQDVVLQNPDGSKLIPDELIAAAQAVAKGL